MEMSNKEYQSYVESKAAKSPIAVDMGKAFVIGGLICATIATLFFVPVVFRLAHGRKAVHSAPAPNTGGPLLGESHA